MFMLKYNTAVAVALLLSATVFAENTPKKERSEGYVTGAFETNTNVYMVSIR